MSQPIRRLFCGVCRGRGILGQGRLCPGCEGAGRVRPIQMSIPVLTPADAAALDTHWWSRLAVLATERRENGIIARGISDTGRELTVSVRPDALAAARRVTFSETEA